MRNNVTILMLLLPILATAKGADTTYLSKLDLPNKVRYVVGDTIIVSPYSNAFAAISPAPVAGKHVIHALYRLKGAKDGYYAVFYNASQRYDCHLPAAIISREIIAPVWYAIDISEWSPAMIPVVESKIVYNYTLAFAKNTHKALYSAALKTIPAAWGASANFYDTAQYFEAKGFVQYKNWKHTYGGTNREVWFTMVGKCTDSSIEVILSEISIRSQWGGYRRPGYTDGDMDVMQLLIREPQNNELHLMHNTLLGYLSDFEEGVAKQLSTQND